MMSLRLGLGVGAGKAAQNGALLLEGDAQSGGNVLLLEGNY